MFNRQTGQLVGAHQRVEQIRRAIGAAPIEPDVTAPGSDCEQWGHVTYLGHRFPVRIVDWSPAKQRAANVAANNHAIAGEFTDGLADFLALVKEETPDVFDELLFATLLSKHQPPTPEVTEDAGAEIDKAGELQKQWQTAVGDVWLIQGKQHTHRLVCGDCTEPTLVRSSMAGSRATCIFTDPPYGVSQAEKNKFLNKEAGGKDGNRQRNEHAIVDDDLPLDQLEQRLTLAFTTAREIAAAEDCSYLVTAPQGGQLGLMMMMMMMQKAGLTPRHVLIWKKNAPTFSMGRLDYDYQHEPILFTWTKRHKRPLLGQHKTSVWEIDKPRASEQHPTMKPVLLYANAYLNHTDYGDQVYEPYAGSGTAFVAAEQTGRVCHGIEIEPRYIAVTLERMTKLGCQCRRDESAAGTA